MKKLFVVDTNVVLFDHTCIYNFKEHDVALSIVVLEELDRFKRGNDLINLEARQFIRELDELAGDGPLTEGLPLGEERGRLFVEIGEATPGRVSQAFALGKPDHRILALAEELRERRKDRQVILVSKDVNLRMKAKSLGPPGRGLHDGQGAPRGPPVLGDRVLGGALGRGDHAAAPRAALGAPRRVRETGARCSRTSTW